MRNVERDTIRRGDIQDAVDVVLELPAVSELRILETRQGVVSGYFNDPEALVDAAAQRSGDGIGVYVTLNPVAPELLARAENRVKPYAHHTTSERDILRLRRLLVDFDPVRRSGISSTDGEHRTALLRTVQVAQWLRARGWAEPLIDDSGNGGHLVYGIDLPNDDPSRRLLGQCLLSLSFRFSDARVVVDVSTAKAAQLWRVPGTLTRKGDDLPDRPHRFAVLLQYPDPFRTVTRPQLETLAALVPTTPSPTVGTPSSGQFNLERWIQEHQLSVVATGEWNGGRKWILRPCPWDPDHTDRAAYIVQFQNGAIAAGCHHNGCAGKNWRALRDLVEPGRHLGRPAALNFGDSENTGGEGAQDWEPPVPFEEFTLPSFPTDALPDWLRKYVDALAIETQTPPDLSALVTLGVLSAVCAKVVDVRVREGWLEQVNLFVVAAMDPGNRKSAVFRDATAPLESAERAESVEQAPVILAAKVHAEAAAERLERARAALAKAPPEERQLLEQEVDRAASDAAQTKVPAAPRLLADDITAEKLMSVLAEQDGRLAVMSAEGNIFEIIAGRYTAGDMANLGVFVKGHAGDAIRVDRINRPAEYTSRPALTLCVTTQPEVIRSLHARREFRGRGLLGRFLYAVPKSLMGQREIRPPTVPAQVRRTYANAIEKLATLPRKRDQDGDLEAYEVAVSPGARDLLEEFQGWLEPQLGPLGALAHMTDWGGKLAGAVVRIAGLLHMATYARAGLAPAPWDRSIDEETMRYAIRIGHYALAHARAAYAQTGADPEIEHAKFALAWLASHEKSTVTFRELYQGTRGRFRRVADLRPALAVLVDHGFLRAQAQPSHPGPGRKPSPGYEVNPLTYSQNPQNTQNPVAAQGAGPREDQND